MFGERIQMKYDLDKKIKKKNKKKNKLTAAQREMRTFLRNRFIKDPELHDRFKSTIEGLYGNNGAYAKALHRHTLRLFLSLVLFLDKAAQLEPPLIPTRKGIFRSDADFKCSEDIVINFAKEALHGEGNIIKHLSNLGYELSFKQSWMHEYAFRIKNLKVDLRDGVCLSRAAEVLTGIKDFEAVGTLKYPAVSRLNKLRNVKTAFAIFKEHNPSFLKDSKIKEQDIVDGHQVKTLEFLWHVIGSYHLSNLIDAKDICKEIQRLGKGDASEDKDDHVSLLLKWAQAVCAQHGIEVENWNSSFMNGTVVCTLLHHYLPSLLSKDEIEYDSKVKNQCQRNFALVYVCISLSLSRLYCKTLTLLLFKQIRKGSTRRIRSSSTR